MTGTDDAHRGEGAKARADARTAHAKARGELTLGWQLLSRAQLPALDLPANHPDNEFSSAAIAADPIGSPVRHGAHAFP